MSQETQIGNLGGGISDEDAKLVDSILNDINSTGPQQGQQGPPQQGQSQQGQPNMGQGGQQPSPEQIKMMQQQQMAQRQAMQQQQMAQQQAMQQQQMAQQQAMQQQQQAMQQQMNQKTNMIENDKSNDILENIKFEAKNVMVVIFLSILFNVDQVDNLFKGITMFLSEDGSLNMQAVFVKAVLIGTIFYVVKTYLL